MIAGADAGKGFTGQTAVVACGAGFVGPHDVYQVMWYEGALLVRGLRGANFHLAVDGDRVTTDDFTVELCGEAECERTFAAGGWSDEDDERFVDCYYHRKAPLVTINATSPG